MFPPGSNASAAKAFNESRLDHSNVIPWKAATISSNVYTPSSRPARDQSRSNGPSSTHHLQPARNAFNSHQLDRNSQSASDSVHLQPPRRVTKKPPTSHIHANAFYDEYSDMQHVVARYKIFESPPISDSKTKFEIFQDPAIRFLEIIRVFFVWLWSFVSRKLRALLSDNQDQILPSHRGASLPQLFKLVIPISGCNLEIEGCVVHSEKLHDVHYQIYRRPDFPENEIKADIIYLPETPLNGPMDVSPLMAAFIHGGHRIIIPQVYGSEKSIPDVGHQSRIIALVLRHLNFKEQESERKLETRQGNFGMQTIATHETASSLSSSSSSSTSSSGRPIFLLGLGHAALVALSYPLEIGQPIHEFPQPLGSFGALSIPSVSARAEPPRSLMGKLSSFCGTVNSGMTGLGWWAQGNARQARAEFKCWGPLPKIHGIIAIGPMLDSSGSNLKQNCVWSKRPKEISPGVGPANYSPSMNNAVKRLHSNASNIRVPVMIAHGTKEAFSVIEGINSFYGALASADSTLIFCPTLRHNGDLAGDSARNGLANDCMKWIGERTDCFGRTTIITMGVSTDTLPPLNEQSEPMSYHTTTSPEEIVTSVEAPSASPTEADEGKLPGQLEEVDCSSDFSSWFGSEGGSSLSRNASGGGESIHSLSSHRTARLSSGSYFFSPELLGSISLEIKLDSADSPHLSSGFSSPALRTPATDYFPFLPSSAKIIDHNHGPHGVVSVVRNNQDSYRSLSCVNIPGSSLELN
ncbi:hypothetical protein PTTG_12019 [Puccinia triticina 1-1 BBBD Race 1]|uniref:Uncharacterized protein n=1 Tax=Puccinia triticina (isolate 1-1 / race 1 (BBBD)) TaxID=630390 RepID=A0A180GZ27_PUCT1|nr:hypothetical protein PTTG_12019 [Puccinia triticina 1-1 BBBD Race 1]